MQYLTDPLVTLFKWSFDSLLVPLGELPALFNPNNLFIIIMFVGLFYWLNLQSKFNKKAAREGGLK